MDKDWLVTGKNITFHHQLGKQKIKVLDGLNLKISKGEIICLRGPSGSGKSTLLNILGLIEPFQDGQLTFMGQNFSLISEQQKNKIRRYQLGFIFQDFQLIDVLSAIENVEWFLARQGIKENVRREIALENLAKVGLEDQIDKKPVEMSGGQRQRVAIARALAKKPSFILADEPTASLDQKTGKQIMSILSALKHKSGVSMIIASHDQMVAEYVDRIITLTDGKITDDQLISG